MWFTSAVFQFTYVFWTVFCHFRHFYLLHLYSRIHKKFKAMIVCRMSLWISNTHYVYYAWRHMQMQLLQTIFKAVFFRVKISVLISYEGKCDCLYEVLHRSVPTPKVTRLLCSRGSLVTTVYCFIALFHTNSNKLSHKAPSIWYGGKHKMYKVFLNKAQLILAKQKEFNVLDVLCSCPSVMSLTGDAMLNWYDFTLLRKQR